MSSQIIAQLIVSGLLMGLVYALIAAGLSLIFGLMDVVNFAHGEFLMASMYVTFSFYTLLGLDPILLLPLVVACMFLFGVAVYWVLIEPVMNVKANKGMAQIFVTFGLGVFLLGTAQIIFTPDYRSINDTILSGRTFSLFGVFVPLPQLAAGVVCLIAFAALFILIHHTDFGHALEATREDAGAVALVGVNPRKMYALGWGIGAAAVGVAGVMMTTFYYIHPGVGSTFVLIAFITVALGGFGSLTGALVGGIIIGLVEAGSAFVVEPALKQLGVFAIYMLVVLVRPRGLFGYF